MTVLTEQQKFALKCAHADLEGVTQSPDGIDTDAIQETLHDLEEAFRDIVEFH
jgi:hypothetical protein